MYGRYMVPNTFSNIKTWPRSAAAKIDRIALGKHADELDVDSGMDISNLTTEALAQSGVDSLGFIRMKIEVEEDEEMYVCIHAWMSLWMCATCMCCICVYVCRRAHACMYMCMYYLPAKTRFSGEML